MQIVRNTDQNAESVEGWLREMEKTGHLPPQDVDQQLPAYSAVDQVPFQPPTLQACCAFQKLDAMNSGTTSNYELREKSPQFRFISWVVLVRTPDHSIPESERLSCPMVWCHARFQKDEYVELVNHLSGCPHLAQAEYNCPYHQRSELFAEPQMPKRAKGSKKRFLKNTLEAIAHLGLRRNKRKSGRETVSEAEKSPIRGTIKRPRYVIEQQERPELGMDQMGARNELDGMAVMAPQMPRRRSMAAELPALYNLFEMEGQLPSEFLYDRAELSDKRFSYTSQSSQDFSTEPSSTPISPVSPQMWYNTHDFDSPISPTDSPISDAAWSNISEHHRQQPLPPNTLSQDRAGPAVQSIDPKNLEVGSSLASHQGDWQQFGYKSSRLVPSIRVDTSCSSGNSVSDSSPDGSGNSSARESQSRHNRAQSGPSLGTIPSPLQIEAESRDPKKLIQELRGLFNTLFKLTVAKIHSGPPMSAGSAILRSHISAASVFDRGLNGLRLLFSGQLPTQFWEVFGISLLAYACGLANQEIDFTKQFTAIYADLQHWAEAIVDAGDRNGYALLVQQLWSPNENCFAPVVSDPWAFLNSQLESIDMQQTGPTMASMMPTDPWFVSDLSQGGQMSMMSKDFHTNPHLANALHDGAAIQLCKQLLDRYEYLSANLGAGAFGPMGLHNYNTDPDAMAGAAQNVYTVRTHILDPLSAMPGLEGFRGIVNNTSLLLEAMPNIPLRHVELVLLQEGKTASKSQTIFRQFIQAVRRLCDRTAASMGASVNRNSFYLHDVESISALHNDLLMQAHSENLDVPEQSKAQGKQPATYSPAISEGESSSSHRPFSWQESPASESPTTDPSSLFISSNSSDAFFSPTPDPALMSFTPPPFPTLSDDPSVAGPSRASPFPIPSSSSNITSQPRSTPPVPGSDSAEGTMTCKICGKVLAGKAVWLPSNMKRHMRELHTPAAKRLVCDVPGCGRAFLRNHNLAHHKKTVHGGK